MSFLQCYIDATITDSVWEKLLGDIILTVGDKIFPATGDQLGIVAPRRKTHSALVEFFGTHQQNAGTYCAGSLLESARQCCQDLLQDLRYKAKQAKQENPMDPAHLGHV